MAEYWLPDVDKARAQDCPYELRLLTQADFPALYRPEWGNALCEKRKELDVLGVGAGLGGDGKADPGDLGQGKGALLLLCMVQCEVGPERGAVRLPPGVGGADGKTCRICGQNEWQIKRLFYKNPLSFLGKL